MRKRTIDFSESKMKKKIFGIKIGTILSVILCLVAAVLFWLFVKYSESGAALAIRSLASSLIGEM